MDPFGTTLGAVALIAPFFNACQKLRQVHRLTQTFGEDYLVEKRYIESQYLRLDQLSKRPVRELVGYKGINVLDSNDPTMKKLISLLAEMKKHSDECDKLIKRYHGTYTLDGLCASLLKIPRKLSSGFPFQNRLTDG